MPDPIAIARSRLAEGRAEEAEALLWRLADEASVDRAVVLAHLAASHTARGNLETARALTRASLYHRRPWVQEAPDGKRPAADAPRVLVLFGAHDQPYKPDDAGRSKLGLGTNLHAFLDRSLFHVVHAFLETLSATPEQLEALRPIDVILSLSVDPAFCADSFPTIESIAAALEAPIINPPNSLRLLARDETCERLSDIEGLLFPRTIKVPVSELSDGWIRGNGFRYPVILRNTFDHFGAGAVLASNATDVDGYRAAATLRDAYVIQYVENGLDDGAGGRVWRRLRVAFFSGRPVPVNLHFDRGWNAHGRARPSLMTPDSDAFAQERAFLEDWQGFVGPKATRALLEIAERMPLDYVGVDFTVLEDGRALIFEANAAMAMLLDHVALAPHLNLTVERYRDEMTALVLRRLADAASRRPMRVAD